ncbi:LacI family DNA-binding transcriptional regulator [Nakamurella deserti]|uniref:LacI family DNA-binding transcriptional regulator n=1 Tax=Nakamurella deserti TaxID=2164074 RepID=UPI00197CAF4C|nr:LacI family DNA-binding transcriptional regulator [Nakamurella deserti]
MTGGVGDRPPPTIYDVARAAGVSKSLVSLVLRDSPQVSATRRAAVHAAIAELGYRPSRAATVLASRRTHSVEVLIDDYRNPSFVGLVRSIQGELSGRGYHLAVSDLQLTASQARADLDNLAARADGLVLAAEPDSALLATWRGPTVVAGWREVMPPQADLVTADDEAGGRQVVAHLRSLGHRRIGHLSGAGGPAARRRTGFEEAVAAAGVDLRLSNTAGGTTEEDGYRAVAALWDRFPDTTAVFAANDSMALGALAALRERGLSVPADVSLVGYDNSPLAQSRYLDLTSVDDRSETVGIGAARALLARIDDPTLPTTRTLLEPVLVARGTSAPPAS